MQISFLKNFYISQSDHQMDKILVTTSTIWGRLTFLNNEAKTSHLNILNIKHLTVLNFA